MPTEL